MRYTHLYLDHPKLDGQRVKILKKRASGFPREYFLNFADEKIEPTKIILMYLFIGGYFVVQTNGICPAAKMQVSGDQGLGSLVLAKTTSSPSVSFHSGSLVLPYRSDIKICFL